MTAKVKPMVEFSLVSSPPSTPASQGIADFLPITAVRNYDDDERHPNSDICMTCLHDLSTFRLFFFSFFFLSSVLFLRFVIVGGRTGSQQQMGNIFGCLPSPSTGRCRSAGLGGAVVSLSSFRRHVRSPVGLPLCITADISAIFLCQLDSFCCSGHVARCLCRLWWGTPGLFPLGGLLDQRWSPLRAPSCPVSPCPEPPLYLYLYVGLSCPVLPGTGALPSRPPACAPRGRGGAFL